MGVWKPPMAFTFNSNAYSSTGQASFSMFAQHHQLPCVILITLSIPILFSKFKYYLTNSRGTCQVLFLNLLFLNHFSFIADKSLFLLTFFKKVLKRKIYFCHKRDHDDGKRRAGPLILFWVFLF